MLSENILTVHQTMQMSFVFVLKMFPDKFNRDCNRDYFQCNRNRLHCDFAYSQSQSITFVM